MWCRSILTAVAITCTLTSEIIVHSQGPRTVVQIKDVVCMLLLSGIQKEDLDTNTLAKLSRHNVNIDDMNNERHRDCMLSPYTTNGLNSNIRVTSEVAITKLPTEVIRIPARKRVEQNFNSLEISPKLNIIFAQNSEDTMNKNEVKGNKTNEILDNVLRSHQIPPLIYRVVENVSNVEENKDLQIRFVNNKPDVESVLDFWTKLTHHTRTVLPTSSPTPSAPSVNTERNFTTSLHFETNNANLHAKEMALIRKLLAEYIGTESPFTIEKKVKSEYAEYTPESIVEKPTKETMKESNISRKSKDNNALSLKDQINELSNLNNFTKDDWRSNMLLESILDAAKGLPLKIMYNNSQHYKKTQDTPRNHSSEAKLSGTMRFNKSDPSILLSNLLRAHEDFNNFASTISYSKNNDKNKIKQYDGPVINEPYKQYNDLPYLNEVKNSSQLSEKKRNVDINKNSAKIGMIDMKQWDPVRIYPTKQSNHVLQTGDYAKRFDDKSRSGDSQKEKSIRMKSKRRYLKSDEERNVNYRTEQPQYLNIVNNQGQPAHTKKHKKKQKKHHNRDMQHKTHKSMSPSIKRKKQDKQTRRTHDHRKHVETTSEESDYSESGDDMVIERRQFGNAYKKNQGNYRYMNNELNMKNEGSPSNREHAKENKKGSQNRQYKVETPKKKWHHSFDSVNQVKRPETSDVTKREQQPAVALQPAKALPPEIDLPSAIAWKPAVVSQPVVVSQPAVASKPAVVSKPVVDSQHPVSSQQEEALQPAAGSHPVVRVRAIEDHQPLSPNIIKEIAEKVKEIVLKDIEKDITIRTVGTTTTQVSIQTTISTTTTTPMPHITTSEKTSTIPKNTEANPVKEKLIEIYKELKGIKEPTTTSTTRAPQPTTVTYVMPIPQKVRTLPPITQKYSIQKYPFQKYPQIFNPYMVKSPPILKAHQQASNNAPYVQVLPYIAHEYNRPITIQTNDDQIAPLAIQISKPLKVMNQHVVITTQDPIEKMKQELERQSKKRIEETFRVPHSDFSNLQFADSPNRHEVSDRIAYKSRFIKDRDRDKPWYNHEYNEKFHRDDTHPMSSRFTGNVNHLHDLNRQSSMSNSEYLPYSGRGNQHEYNQPQSLHSDMISLDITKHNSGNHGYPNYDRYESPKYHENPERENWQRNSWKELKSVSAENSYEEIPARHQMPIVKEKQRMKYDDTHFTNFLKSQQKVTDMLEKMLATNVKNTGGPQSAEMP